MDIHALAISIVSTIAALLSAISAVSSFHRVIAKIRAERSFERLLREKMHDDDDLRRELLAYLTLLERMEREGAKYTQAKDRTLVYEKILRTLEYLTADMEERERRFVVEGLRQPSEQGRAAYIAKLLAKSESSLAVSRY